MLTVRVVQQCIAAAHDPGVDGSHDKWNGPLLGWAVVVHAKLLRVVGSAPAKHQAHQTREKTTNVASCRWCDMESWMLTMGMVEVTLPSAHRSDWTSVAMQQLLGHAWRKQFLTGIKDPK